MKLATGTTLTCPKCLGELCDSDPERPECARFGPKCKVFEAVHGEEGSFGMLYVECLCGLCMICQWANDGWEYRVML